MIAHQYINSNLYEVLAQLEERLRGAGGHWFESNIGVKIIGYHRLIRIINSIAYNSPIDGFSTDLPLGRT